MGLEKILEEIKKENQEQIEQIQLETKKIVDEMIEKENDIIQTKKSLFEKELVQMEKLDLEKGISSAISQRKRMVLQEKQKFISQIIDQAKEYIQNLPKKEYIEFFTKLALNYAHKEDGIIKLTLKDKQDKDGLAKELVDTLNEQLSKNSKGNLKLSEQVCTEKTGFVMVYGEVEENCSLEAIFSEKREVLEDKINSFLFA